MSTKKKMHTTMTHFEASQRSEVGIKLSLGSGGGCNSLKNSSTCNIKFNQHQSITKKKKKTQESLTGMTHIAASEKLVWKIELSLGSRGGCNWLKNGSTYSTNERMHMPL